MAVYFIRPGTTSFTPGAGVTSIKVEMIAGGSSGGFVSGASSPGGVGGDYASSVLTVTPGTAIACQVGTGGARTVTGLTVSTTQPRNAGVSSWFGGTSLATASVVAAGGLSGDTSVGTTVNAGGTGTRAGGGAGGPNGAGGTSSSPTSGAGDAGFGGAGVGNTIAGNPGAEWTQTSDGATAGSGSGGGGSGTVAPGGDGGACGGGGGSANSANHGDTAHGGAGGDGIIVVTELASTVSATASQTAAAPAQSAAGTVKVAAGETVTVAAPAQAAHVFIAVHAAQAKTVPAPAQVANGATGRLLRAPTQTAAAVVKVSGTGAQSLRPPAQAATAADPVHAAQAKTVPAPAQAAALHAVVHAAASRAVPAPAQAAVLFAPVHAAAAQLMRPPAQVFTGSTGRHLPPPSQIATVDAVASARAVQLVPAPAQHAAGFVLDNLGALRESGNGCGANMPGPFTCPTLDQSIEQTLALLPSGPAWPARDLGNYARFSAWLAGLGGRIPRAADWPFGHVQVGFYAAFGAVRNYLETRLCDLRLEFWCATHRETHAEWLLEYGLPDECDPFPDLCAKVAAIGGRRCELYAALAARLGWSIECEANTRCADRALAGRARAGRARASGSRASLVRIVVHTAASPSFNGRFQTPPRAGRMRAGMRAACPPNIDPLRCLIDRIAPAHVIVEYDVAA